MSQKRILIISYPYDVHARAVADAVRTKGHICEELFCADYPTLMTATLMASNENNSWSKSYVRHRDGKIPIFENAFDTVWLRRRRPPWLPDTMHPGDREIALRQSEHCLLELFAAVSGPNVYWVNDLDRELTAYLKMNQLRNAVRADLSIPDTIVSNDPDEIRYFFDRCSGNVIHKMMRGGAWISNDKEHLFSCPTVKVTKDMLPGDEILRLSPAIFQSLIPKKFEIRVACFGNHLEAISLNSQSDDRASVDWRVGQKYIEMKPHTLPLDIAEKIRRFLQLAGLAYAALDFIVTPDNEYIFLEANPQGQFLWMESRTGIPALEHFCQYLIAGKMDFHPTTPEIMVTWDAFSQKWENGFEKEAVENHVVVTERNFASDFS